MSTVRIADDSSLITPLFKLMPVYDEAKSKAAGRPMYNEMEVCEIYLAANKYTQGVFPAHEVCGWKEEMTEAGPMRTEVTYATKFQKQYLEFKSGNKQSLSGTLLAEVPFITQAKRLELKALNVHTLEALAALDGANLKMLGPNGRDLKNQAVAYLEKSAVSASAGVVADELAKANERIAELERLMASKPETATADGPSDAVVSTFATFSDEDLKAWLTDAGVTVDNRWGRATLIIKADEILAKEGKAKRAA